MKARLLYDGESVVLLTADGKTKKMTLVQGRQFFGSYNDASHYAGVKAVLSEKEMMQYGGDTIAVVDSDGKLIVHDSEYFFAALNSAPVVFLSAVDYAAKHNKRSGVVRQHCTKGRIPGAQVTGAGWIIPEDAPYPEDARFGTKVQQKNWQ